jgi:Ca2+:H+ antiporter
MQHVPAGGPLLQQWRRPDHFLPIVALVLALANMAGGAEPDLWSVPLKILGLTFFTALIFATVFVVLHHAEVIAHRLGEPYGTLLLTLAVTIIEVSVITSMMLHGENNPTLARESVYSTVMLVTTGVVGVCLTLGGLRHRSQEINRQGTSAYLSVLMALTALTLILPDFSHGGVPGSFGPAELGMVSLLAILLYGAFVFTQTVRHPNDFIAQLTKDTEGAVHPVDRDSTLSHVLLLFLGLLGIVLLTEQIAGAIENGLHTLQVGRTDSIVGLFIATLVLMPEALAAIRASLNNELQRGLNVALGSACATIGMTIPAIGAVSLLTGKELTLGLESQSIVLLLLALGVSILSFGTGHTTMLTGLVHLVVFVAYLLMVFVS